MRNAKRSREHTFRIHDDGASSRIWDLNPFESPFGFQMLWTTGSGHATTISHSTDPIFSWSPSPPPLTVILRYRASTTWALSIGRCAPASCALDFGIGIKRFDHSIRTVKIRAQIARIDATCATDGEFESFI